MTPLPRPIWPGRPKESDVFDPARQSADECRAAFLQHCANRQHQLAEQDALRQERELRAIANHRQPRTIAQLCGSTEGLFALCNDGTVWQLLGGMWLPEPGIPQRQVVEP